MDAKVPAQNVGDYLPCCGLADRAGYRNDRKTGLLAVLSGKLAERRNGIANPEQTLSGGRGMAGGPFDDCTDGPSLVGLAEIVVAVEALPPEGQEGLAGTDGSTVGAQAPDNPFSLSQAASIRGSRYLGKP